MRRERRTRRADRRSGISIAASARASRPARSPAAGPAWSRPGRRQACRVLDIGDMDSRQGITSWARSALAAEHTDRRHRLRGAGGQGYDSVPACRARTVRHGRGARVRAPRGWPASPGAGAARVRRAGAQDVVGRQRGSSAIAFGSCSGTAPARPAGRLPCLDHCLGVAAECRYRVSTTRILRRRTAAVDCGADRRHAICRALQAALQLGHAAGHAFEQKASRSLPHDRPLSGWRQASAGGYGVNAPRQRVP